MNHSNPPVDEVVERSLKGSVVVFFDTFWVSFAGLEAVQQLPGLTGLTSLGHSALFALSVSTVAAIKRGVIPGIKRLVGRWRQYAPSPQRDAYEG